MTTPLSDEIDRLRKQVEVLRDALEMADLQFANIWQYLTNAGDGRAALQVKEYRHGISAALKEIEQ